MVGEIKFVDKADMVMVFTFYYERNGKPLKYFK